MASAYQKSMVCCAHVSTSPDCHAELSAPVLAPQRLLSPAPARHATCDEQLYGPRCWRVTQAAGATDRAPGSATPRFRGRSRGSSLAAHASGTARGQPPNRSTAGRLARCGQPCVRGRLRLASAAAHAGGARGPMRGNPDTTRGQQPGPCHWQPALCAPFWGAGAHTRGGERPECLQCAHAPVARAGSAASHAQQPLTTAYLRQHTARGFSGGFRPGPAVCGGAHEGAGR